MTDVQLKCKKKKGREDIVVEKETFLLNETEMEYLQYTFS